MSVIIQNDIEEYVFFRVGSGMNNYYFFLNFFGKQLFLRNIFLDRIIEFFQNCFTEIIYTQFI